MARHRERPELGELVWVDRPVRPWLSALIMVGISAPLGAFGFFVVPPYDWWPWVLMFEPLVLLGVLATAETTRQHKLYTHALVTRTSFPFLFKTLTIRLGSIRLETLRVGRRAIGRDPGDSDGQWLADAVVDKHRLAAVTGMRTVRFVADHHHVARRASDPDREWHWTFWSRPVGFRTMWWPPLIVDTEWVFSFSDAEEAVARIREACRREQEEVFADPDYPLGHEFEGEPDPVTGLFSWEYGTHGVFATDEDVDGTRGDDAR